MRRRTHLLASTAWLVLACTTADAPQIVEEPDFAVRFQEAGVRGTFVLYDAQAHRYLVHDSVRARERFIPASTFKIPNSLIALELGVVADTLTVFTWDGTERAVPQWNRDQTLASAYDVSAVWVYQEVARRVGEGRMHDYVQRMGYGNADIGGGIDQFWLTGALRISAMEQVAFLESLHERRLPFSDRAVDLVEGIMVEDRGEGWELRAKTGWAGDVGWYVGYVTREGRPYYFALNLVMERPEQEGARRGVARAILGDLGLLPTGRTGA